MMKTKSDEDEDDDDSFFSVVLKRYVVGIIFVLHPHHEKKESPISNLVLKQSD